MILKASQRGGGKQLGLHLMNSHDNEHVEVHAPLDAQRIAMCDEQRRERLRFDATLKHRQQKEAKERASRLRTGVLGLWDRVRGEYKKIEVRNAREARQATIRDRQQRHTLLASQHAERRKLQADINRVRSNYRSKALELWRDLKQRGQTPRIPRQADNTLNRLHSQFNVQASQPERTDRLNTFKEERKQQPRRDRNGQDLDRN